MRKAEQSLVEWHADMKSINVGYKSRANAIRPRHGSVATFF